MRMWLLGICGVVAAADAGEPRASQFDKPGVVFHCDFEGDDWYKQWGEASSPTRVQTINADSVHKFEPLRGRALQVRVDRDGHYGVSLSYQFKKRLGREPEEIYFRYYLRLANDWDPRRGGKLPGFGGTYGRAGWGGRPVDGTDGWSARGLFHGQKERQTPVGFYCYHMDMKGRYGSEWVWDRDELGRLLNNRWYCIEQHVRLNTLGQRDGILQGWVDGHLAFERTDIRFREVDTLKIESVWLNVYLGGLWTSASDHHLYLDEVVISKRPIGPLSNP